MIKSPWSKKKPLSDEATLVVRGLRVGDNVMIRIRNAEDDTFYEMTSKTRSGENHDYVPRTHNMKLEK